MSPRRPLAARAFTLIELLVVIAIIAVLAGLLFPVVGGVQDRARKTQAASDCGQIATAVKAYFSEYGKYPMQDDKQGYDTVFGDADYSGGTPQGGLYDNSLVFNALRAIAVGTNANHVLNPKQVIYFEGKEAKDPVKHTNGFVKKAGDALNGRYYDPFGAEYVIFVDGNYDGMMKWHTLYKDLGGDPETSPSTAMRLSVGVCSRGKDLKFGFKGDNNFRNPKSDDVATW